MTQVNQLDRHKMNQEAKNTDIGSTLTQCGLVRPSVTIKVTTLHTGYQRLQSEHLILHILHTIHM